MPVPRLLCASALIAVLALAGCGGDDNEQSSATTTGAQAAERQAPTTAGQQPQTQAKGSEQPEQKAQSIGTTADSAPEPGTKSAAPGVPVTPGGDNSIQTFGAEGEVSEREQAVTTLKAYLNARAAKQWARACAQASEEFKQQLGLMLANAKAKKGAEKPKGCADTLKLFFGRAPKAQLRRDAQVRELLSFRVAEKNGGKYAYVIYKGADGKTRFIAMKNDSGEWKVNVTEPAEFPGVS